MLGFTLLVWFTAYNALMNTFFKKKIPMEIPMEFMEKYFWSQWHYGNTLV